MAFDFIFMLTSEDRTVPDALDRVEEVVAGGARHIGFKDVGLPVEELQRLTDRIRGAGARVYLEVVSLDEASEVHSADAAVALNVDFLLGGTRADLVVPRIKDTPIRYYPFAGEVVGHPSRLAGSVDAVVRSAVDLCAREGVDGLDLLAYRSGEPVADLMRQVCKAVDKPVIMAGSIDSDARIADVAQAGAAGFTVGTAAFDGRFPADGDGLAGQVRAIMASTLKHAAGATRPRRFALVAHDAKKQQMAAWVGRHAERLKRHELLCTGTTGTIVLQANPDLRVKRLQSGPRGGDQQIGALIAEGAIDGLIFFIDPMSAQPHDVDVKALMRLAVLCDTPVAYSPATADLFVTAGLF